jgi:hypothetical protein
VPIKEEENLPECHDCVELEEGGERLRGEYPYDEGCEDASPAVEGDLAMWEQLLRKAQVDVPEAPIALELNLLVHIGGCERLILHELLNVDAIIVLLVLVQEVEISREHLNYGREVVLIDTGRDVYERRIEVILDAHLYQLPRIQLVDIEVDDQLLECVHLTTFSEVLEHVLERLPRYEFDLIAQDELFQAFHEQLILAVLLDRVPYAGEEEPQGVASDEELHGGGDLVVPAFAIDVVVGRLLQVAQDYVVEEGTEEVLTLAVIKGETSELPGSTVVNLQAQG